MNLPANPAHPGCGVQEKGILGKETGSQEKRGENTRGVAIR